MKTLKPTFYCERYHCLMPRGTCIVRHDRALDSNDGDPGCRLCHQGRQVKRQTRRHHLKQAEKRLDKISRLARKNVDNPMLVERFLVAVSDIRDSLIEMGIEPERAFFRMSPAARREKKAFRDQSAYNGGKYLDGTI